MDPWLVKFSQAGEKTQLNSMEPCIAECCFKQAKFEICKQEFYSWKKLLPLEFENRN